MWAVVDHNNEFAVEQTAVAAVPEPGTLALLAAGAAVFVAYGLRRRAGRRVLVKLLAAEGEHADPHRQEDGQAARGEAGQRAYDEPVRTAIWKGAYSLKEKAGSTCRAR